MHNNFKEPVGSNCFCLFLNGAAASTLLICTILSHQLYLLLFVAVALWLAYDHFKLIGRYMKLNHQVGIHDAVTEMLKEDGDISSLLQTSLK